jgi:hypothetical protein
MAMTMYRTKTGFLEGVTRMHSPHVKKKKEMTLIEKVGAADGIRIGASLPLWEGDDNRR